MRAFWQLIAVLEESGGFASSDSPFAVVAQSAGESRERPVAEVALGGADVERALPVEPGMSEADVEPAPREAVADERRDLGEPSTSAARVAAITGYLRCCPQANLRTRR